MKGQLIADEKTLRHILAGVYRALRRDPTALTAFRRGWLAGATVGCSAETWQQNERLTALIMGRQPRLTVLMKGRQSGRRAADWDDLYNTFGCPPGR